MIIRLPCSEIAYQRSELRAIRQEQNCSQVINTRITPLACKWKSIRISTYDMWRLLHIAWNIFPPRLWSKTSSLVSLTCIPTEESANSSILKWIIKDILPVEAAEVHEKWDQFTLHLNGVCLPKHWLRDPYCMILLPKISETQSLFVCLFFARVKKNSVVSHRASRSFHFLILVLQALISFIFKITLHYPLLKQCKVAMWTLNNQLQSSEIVNEINLS